MRSYLKFLSHNKLYTAIEAVGLIVSMAFVILIGSYVRQQWKVAHGAPEWKHYYDVTAYSNGLDMAQYGLANLIKENVPGVDRATMLGMQVIKGTVNDTPVDGLVWVVEPDYFDMFPVEWVRGSEHDLRGGGIAISESKAREMDDGRDIIGRTLYSRNDTLTIYAVYRDMGMPLIQPETGFLQVKEYKTMVMQALVPGTACLISSSMDEDELKPVLEDLFTVHDISKWARKSGQEFNGELERLDRMYFSDLNRLGISCFKKGNLSLLKILSAVVLLLLLSAVFNYINLSTALAGRRVKEMGTRAILGASRKEIAWSQLRESLLFTIVCMVFAILLAHAFTPILTHFVDVRNNRGMVLSEPFSWEWDTMAVCAVLLFTVLLGLLAGWLPTRIASSYNLAQVVKGDYRVRNKRVFSKIFIVFQAALAVMLISFALVLDGQFSHMIHRPLGGNVKDLYCQAPVSDAHVNAVLALPFVAEHGWSVGWPGGAGMMSSRQKPGSDEMEYTGYIQCDTAAFRMFDFDIAEDFNSPGRSGYWLSETASVVPMEDNAWFKGDEMAGIVKDFALTDAAHMNPGEIGIVLVSNSTANKNLIVRITGNHADAERKLSELYKKFSMERNGNEGYPHLNYFMEDKLREGLQEAERYLRMIELFMILAVLVSQLGLLAMSAFFAGEKTHDVAVRKVFGGTVEGEVARGVREYMLLVCIACVLAVPVAVWLSERYLQDFNYRISNYGWIFAVAVIISLAIAFGTVLWQTLKAAKTNPAVELKKE